MTNKSKKDIYRFEHWTANIKMLDIIKELNYFYGEGWEVVSHSQGQFGMSVILKKQHDKQK